MSERKKKYVFVGTHCTIGPQSYNHGDVAEFTEEEFEHALQGRAAFEPVEERPIKVNI